MNEAVAETSGLKQPLFFRGINLPIYFKYVCGNVVDVSTLTRTMKELKAYNIDTNFAVLDAGYLTAENTRELYDSKVSFIS